METVNKVGATDDVNASVVRIVHISDTHSLHNEFVANNLIPNGDILVHSGDFSKASFERQIFRESDYLSEIEAINNFFIGLPHKIKIFVAGNHETNFPRQCRERTASLLSTSCIYLEDASVTVEGIKFYGSPWNGLRHSSVARSFAVSYSSLASHWTAIPDDTDVLVTHSPVHGLLDLGSNKHLLGMGEYCHMCQQMHNDFMHFGCTYLLKEVLQRIRPRAHLFGHAHEPSGVLVHDQILFSNAAMACNKKANIIDFYLSADRKQITETVPQYHSQINQTCTVM